MSGAGPSATTHAPPLAEPRARWKEPLNLEFPPRLVGHEVGRPLVARVVPNIDLTDTVHVRECSLDLVNEQSPERARHRCQDHVDGCPARLDLDVADHAQVD